MRGTITLAVKSTFRNQDRLDKAFTQSSVQHSPVSFSPLDIKASLAYIETAVSPGYGAVIVEETHARPARGEVPICLGSQF
jgi:F420-0:gamma-glutamyl ligase